MLWGSSPAAVATRFTDVAQNYVADGPAERAERAKRALLSAVAHHEPATLNHVADATGRGAPAVSRSIDALVRMGLIDRVADPNNRRRLAMRLTQEGKAVLERPYSTRSALVEKLGRMAPSELRAVERAIEILERAT
jgi:DNA-binding MarR family transcriptional regulator